MSVTTTDLVEARFALVFKADVERRVSWSVLVGKVQRDGDRWVLDLGRRGVIPFHQSWLQRMKQPPYFMRSILLGAEYFLPIEVEKPPPEADLRWHIRGPTVARSPN